MKFKILHENRGRIRLHSMQKRMTLQQADLLEAFLLGQKNVISCKVNESTMNVIICYSKDRDELIKKLSHFHYEDNKDLLSLTEHSSRELNKQYKEKLVGLVATKIFTSLFMPFKIRKYYIGIKAIPYIFRGIKTLLKLKLKVDVLDGLAVGLSLLRGDYGTVSSVTFLLRLGELLEEWTHKRSIDDLARSMSLGVDRVWKKTGNAEELVPIGSIKPDDRIIMRMGNVIPFDGIIESGEVMVNQASMTGESLPVHKNENTSIYAGTVVEEGECIMIVKEQSGESRYDKIVHLIEESEKLKSNVEAKAASLADKLVPYTILGSVVSYILTRNTMKALSVLMVDFSCALKLSMPLSVLSAMSEAGVNHITIKGGRFLEMVANADTIVFDKTGTLTYATPTVVKITAFGGNDENEMLRIAACLEEHFPHSIATAVVNAALEKNLQHDEMHSELEYIVAHGISSRIDDRRAVIGSYHFVFEDEGCVVPSGEEYKMEALKKMYSHLYLAIDGKLSAVISICDPLRAEAKEVINKLRSLGISKLVMLTGDSYNTAKSIAKQLNIDHFEAGVLPEDKAGFIEKEKAAGRTVIMIGDGINDSPALSAADVGIAISEGASIAKEISDITISGNNLNELVFLRLLSIQLMQRIKCNYRTVIGFNMGLILAGLMGFLAPTTSALLHNASTIAISLNSMTKLLDDKKLTQYNIQTDKFLT